MPSPLAEPGGAGRAARSAFAGRERALAAGLAATALVVFAPSVPADFVEWDDYPLLVTNPSYRGLGWAQLSWMVSTTLLGHYVPVTWVSFGLDYLVWGMRPAGYHLTNVLLHAANTGLVFLLAVWLLGKATRLPRPARQAGAAFAALAFALHPLRVEAVTWVTGRRDVLAGFWFLLSVLAYLRAAESSGRPRGWWRSASLAGYALALLSKAVVMTAPLVLLVLDVYPLGRLPGDPRRWGEPTARRVWREKVPYVLLAAAGAVVSYVGQARGSGVTILDGPTWLGAVLFSLWFHVEKTVVPVGLSPLVELPLRIDPLEPRVLVALAGVVAVGALVLRLGRSRPAGLAATLCYAALLAPVSGMAHAGPQLTADRYSYLACLGWAILAGGGLGWLAARRPTTALVAGALVLAPLAGLTVRQIGFWQDTGRLWQHAVEVAPGCAECRVNLGNWFHAHGDSAAAIGHFEQALVLRPDRVQVHTNVGLALVRLGRTPEAVPHYVRVLAWHPDAIGVRVSLVTALVALGRRREAIATLDAALRFAPAAQLAAYFRDLTAASPAAAVPRLGLTQAYRALGARDRAQEQQAVLATLDPELARLLTGLAANGP